MKKIIAALLLVTAFETQAQDYLRIHANATVVDTHNDVISTASMRGLPIDSNLTGTTHSDINRFAKGGVDVQVFSIFCDERYGIGTAFNYALREIDTLDAVAKRNPTKMKLVNSPADLAVAVRNHQLAAMKGVEGGHMIEDRLDYLDSLYKRGARYMTLTWNNSTSWASSAKDETSDSFPRKKGLNDFGKQIVKHMNEIGMMVDLSHVGVQTFFDAIAVTTKPVIVSHSCAYALCPVFRNMTDEQIRAVGKNDGVIHVNFYSGFLDSTYQRHITEILQRHKKEVDSLMALGKPNYEVQEWIAKQYPEEVNSIRPPLSLLIDHIDHMVKIAGVDHVGLGSDFDGIESAPKELNGVVDFPLITKALLERGYSQKDARKILGGNFIRVFEANQKKS
jgi:membrane dipeptidase